MTRFMVPGQALCQVPRAWMVVEVLPTAYLVSET